MKLSETYVKQIKSRLHLRQDAYKQKFPATSEKITGKTPLWALTDSNRRPSACKADALNQLS